jgi:hypothetical protein
MKSGQVMLEQKQTLAEESTLRNLGLLQGKLLSDVYIIHILIEHTQRSERRAYVID